MDSYYPNSDSDLDLARCQRDKAVEDVRFYRRMATFLAAMCALLTIALVLSVTY